MSIFILKSLIYIAKLETDHKFYTFKHPYMGDIGIHFVCNGVLKFFSVFDKSTGECYFIDPVYNLSTKEMDIKINGRCINFDGKNTILGNELESVLRYGRIILDDNISYRGVYIQFSSKHSLNEQIITEDDIK